MFSGEFLDGAEVKREGDCVSTAMPIPRRGDLVDLRDLSVELDISQDSFTNLSKLNYDPDLGERFPMDDDDIFQVDEADLIHGPTLAELNAINPDALIDVDLDFGDFILPDNIKPEPVAPLQPLSVQNLQSAPSSPYTSSPYTSSPHDVYGRSQAAFSPSSQHSSASSSLLQTGYTLHELPPRHELLGKSVPPVPPLLRLPAFTQQLSSSAPTHSHLTRDQIWQRREPRKHLVSTSSVAEVGSVSSLSGGLLSPGYNLSQDEDDRSDDNDSERYEDLSSDESDAESPDGRRRRRKKERYFWQYNVQAKGPKGQRLVVKSKFHDPHVLNSVTDPVFSSSCVVRGIKHSGKARKGDGNDLTPNPRKLYAIGRELDSLARVIGDMTPVSELPAPARPRTRREKNKLASRACRLKKKAQHEANKLKLYGLEKEHKLLLRCIEQMRGVLMNRINSPQQDVDWSSHVHSIMSAANETIIAGRTSQFVNEILETVSQGAPSGGLSDLQ